MGKLTKLLLNEKTASYTPVDGKKYKRYGQYVNLLRMILLGQSGKYTTMPTTPKAALIFGDGAMAVEMTNAYKKLRAKLKDPKVTVAELKTVKKGYFELLFGELMRGANIPEYRPTFLATAFSKGKHGDFNIQQQTIIYKFAKKLLMNKENLEGRDVSELNLIIGGFEEENADVIEQEQTANIADNPKLIAKVNQMADAEIIEAVNNISSKIDVATADSRAKQTEAQVLADELNYPGLDVREFTDAKMINKIIDPTLEPIAIEMKNKFVNKIVNMKTKYGETKDAFLHKTLTTFTSDAISQFANYIPDNIKNGNIEFICVYTEEANAIFFLMADEAEGITLQRTFHLDNQGNVASVNHDFFELPAKAQKTGLSKAAIGDALKLYKAIGVKKIDLHANIGMGGYVWLRYGFRPYPEEIPSISEGFVTIANSVKYGLKSGQTVGVTPEMAFDALIAHFKNPEFATFLQEIKTKYVEVDAVVQKIWSEFNYDPHLSDEAAPVRVDLKFEEVIAEIFSIIGNQLKTQFVVNPETLYADISMTKIPVTIKAPTIKLIIDPRQTTRAKEVIKSKIPKTSYSMGGTGKFMIETKHILTITGINATNEKDELIPMFPASPSDFANGFGRMPGALDWKGSLDLTDEKQFQLAMDYATSKKS